ncbi:hypothetical protein AOY38_16375 [Synechocystis sp. PCC 6803]|nr:hypothetical protein AOY38_16375 [Synechocystis sp. PCC 6803]AVP91135.1 hypothetical protein C7I86_16530 [Synechocystis sp. IPPAS B-1465]BAM53269.1 Phytoene dehydrogenase and related proteins [Synechocystis sp. PCC 6803] [Bacillus subtilis BEST7613]
MIRGVSEEKWINNQSLNLPYPSGFSPSKWAIFWPNQDWGEGSQAKYCNKGSGNNPVAVYDKR